MKHKQTIDEANSHRKFSSHSGSDCRKQRNPLGTGDNCGFTSRTSD
jgi:hypothetical protein